MTTPRVFEGLAGVLVARTELSCVDGERGRLSVRGRAIESLVSELPFEAMLGLLLEGSVPEAARRQAWQTELGEARQRAQMRLASRFDAVWTPDAMTTLRSALSLLSGAATPCDVLGMAAVASAAWIRKERGGQLPAPEPGLPHAHDLLRMLSAREVSGEAARLLDAYLVTVAEHGVNAAAVATRVAASTG